MISRRPSCWLPDTPLSITATFTPWPLVNCHAPVKPSTCSAQGAAVPADDRSPSCWLQLCTGCTTCDPGVGPPEPAVGLGDGFGVAADIADLAGQAGAAAATRTCAASRRTPPNTTTATRLMNAP